jgi:hypothetical protein
MPNETLKFTPYDEASNAHGILNVEILRDSVDFEALKRELGAPAYTWADKSDTWFVKDQHGVRYAVSAPAPVPYSPIKPVNYVTLSVLGDIYKYKTDLLTGLAELVRCISKPEYNVPKSGPLAPEL